MLHPRVIPSLLLYKQGLVKTTEFKNPRYLGDPINAVKIFNEKEVDELVFLDIGATALGHPPNFDLLNTIANEAFMPFGYGGGIRSTEDIKKLYGLGVEKVILNTILTRNLDLISEAIKLGSSAGVVVSIDVRRNWLGKYSVYVNNGQRDTKRDPVGYARQMEQLGAGEILLNSIDRDGSMKGYDLELIKMVSSAVSIPVVAVGGAGKLEHFRDAIDSGASAASAGSIFVFYGKHRAVLITYPEYEELDKLFS